MKWLWKIYDSAVRMVVSGMAIACISSCVQEDMPCDNVEEGLPVTAVLSFRVPQGNDVQLSTKAELNDYSVISSLYLFVYNADGTHCEEIIEVPSSDIKETQNAGKYGRYYTAKINTTTGSKAIFAVANYENVESWVGHTDAGNNISFRETINDLGTRAITEGLTMSQIAGTIVYLTDTYLNNGTTPEYPTQQMIFTSDIDGDKITFSTNGSTGQINLQRIVANVIFNIKNGSFDDKIVSFNPTHYQLFNLPEGTRLGSKRGIEENPSEADADFYYDGTEQTLTKTSTEGVFTFDFFIPENIQKEVNGLEYSERDEWEFTAATGDNPGENVGASNDSKDFTNAPDNATYIVIGGEYAEYEKDKEGNQGRLIYSGNTSYVIHLGNMDKANEGSDGDFSVRRNWKYTYNITINGVQNIVNEARGDNLSDTNQGVEPGAEGGIVNIEEMTLSYSLDAHYEQVLLSYNLSNIAERIRTMGGTDPDTDDDGDGISDVDELIGNSLILYIESPFQDGAVTKIPYLDYVKAVKENIPEENAKAAYLEDADYKWVEFWPQNSNTDFASYPGLPRWKNDGNDIRPNSNDNEKLLDAYDVCVNLGKAVKKIWQYLHDGNSDYSKVWNDGDYADDIIVRYSNGSWYAYFTGFVDEYYYTEYPVSANGHTAGEAVGRWSEFTNKNQRRMMISMDIEVSPDGNSTYSRAHTNISQRSIQTFYDDDTDEPITAFGMETFNETPRMEYGTPSNGTYSDTDGRSNSLTMLNVGGWGARDWDYYINEAENGHKTSISGRRTLNDAYKRQAAYAACLSRNRDLDGDGNIDIDEIRWYMPSINEYIRIGMGATAISNEAQLYFGDKNDLSDGTYPGDFLDYGALYYTSTYNSNNPSDPGRSHYKVVFWAVEKGSYGDQLTSYDGGRYMIRCVRLLPSDVDTDLHDYDGVPASIYNLKETSEGNYFFDFRGRLTPELFRQIPNTYPYNFLQHNEDSEYNRFYYGMVLSRNYLTGTYNQYDLDELQNVGNNRDNPCADYNEDGLGWRLPNLAELTVLASDYENFVNIGANVPCCTQFYNQDVREAFYINTSQMVTCHNGYGGNFTFQIRCVRDATAAELERYK